jgi:hypothetical protein
MWTVFENLLIMVETHARVSIENFLNRGIISEYKFRTETRASRFYHLEF